MIAPELARALTGDLDDWVGVLPPYQQDLLRDMLSRNDPVEVSITWLSTSGPNDTAPFGGVRQGASLFYDKLLEQVRILLCGSTGFEQERAQLVRDAHAGRAVIVTGVAGAVAPAIGASPVVLAPVIALTLAVVSRAGIQTICETLDSIIAARSSATEAEAPDQLADRPPSE